MKYIVGGIMYRDKPLPNLQTIFSHLLLYSGTLFTLFTEFINIEYIILYVTFTQSFTTRATHYHEMARTNSTMFAMRYILFIMGCSLPPLGGIGACYQHIIHLLNQPNDPLQVASLQGYLLPKKAHPMQYH